MVSKLIKKLDVCMNWYFKGGLSEKTYEYLIRQVTKLDEQYESITGESYIIKRLSR